MNIAPCSGRVPTSNRRFILELIGFSNAEKQLLTSTFRLTAQRPFCYAEAVTPDERADIYLVNTDDAQAKRQLGGRSPNLHSPVVCIGHPPADHWPLVERPIQWMRLFAQLDKQMEIALHQRDMRSATGRDIWDGQTFRRAIDKFPDTVVLQPVVNESVLVVDDSATVRAFMRAKLAPFRLNVDYAESGEKAIDMAQAKSYTCIFLDILMSGMDGYQVCKQIKSSAATKHTAVVMLSSKTSAFDKFRGSWAGCDAYLGKPVGEDELLATVARFLPSARSTVDALLSQNA